MQSLTRPSKKRSRTLECEKKGCDYVTTVIRNFARHSRMHTGERPFKCEGCDYATTASRSLKTQMRRHTGERPYKCEEESCNNAATQSGDLKLHMLTHTGERPFMCEEESGDYARRRRAATSRRTSGRTRVSGLTCARRRVVTTRQR